MMVGGIGYKVLHRVLREELLHLTVKLTRQSLVMGDYERRLVQSGDHVSHGEGLAGSRSCQDYDIIFFIFIRKHRDDIQNHLDVYNPSSDI